MDTNVLTVALLLLAGAAVLWGIFLAGSRRQQSPGSMLGIPHALRPGAADSTLEGPRLERIQIGGVLFTLVLAVFIPMYWLPEASRQAAFQERFDEESLHRGELIFQDPPTLEEDADPVDYKEEERAISLGMACANCHGGVDDENPENSAGGGLASPAYVDPVTNAEIQYQAPPLQNVFQRWDEEVVRFTIERGRPPSPMAAWGVEYGGPMTDQMIDDVMAWLASLPGNQTNPNDAISESCQDPRPGISSDACGEEIFTARCAVCHGPEGQGKEGVGTTEDRWYQGKALWKGDVTSLDERQHYLTIVNGRRFAFMPQFGESPTQGVPLPPYPLTDAQIKAVMEYERGL
jgi:mono/diheme cytochrome c family protein